MPARMLPPRIPEDTRSRAERRLFRLFEEQGDSSWVVIHSLGLHKHARKPWAEADFVVITPDGVFVLEVKGGRIRRDGREWFTNQHRLKESPFDQAAGAAAALHHDLREHSPAIEHSLVGHGVCFPDVLFPVDGTDIDPALVFDASDAVRPVTAYLERLSARWRARLDTTSRRPRRPLSPAEIQSIVNRIAPDFDLLPTLGAEIDDARREMVRLTREQGALLQSLNDNRRVVVRGGAGSGKTLMAVADAKRQAARGRNVLLVCHSNALSDYLAAALSGHPNVTVRAFQRLCGDLISAVGSSDPRPASDDDYYFGRVRPTRALEAYAEHESPQHWDVVIVDEAQDLLTAPASDLLDVLIKGGWKSGMWRLYLDPFQDIFAASQPEIVSELTADAAVVDLTTNCRNTAPIARDASIASKAPFIGSRSADGPEPQWLPYADEREQLKLVSRTLKTWLQQGIPPEDICILSPVRREKSVLRNGLPTGTPCSLTDGPVIRRADRAGAIQFSTVAAFKGLESDAVLLLDARDLGRKGRAGTVYVGLTRAKVLLAVLRPCALDQTWSELVVDFGRRLADSDEDIDIVLEA